MRHATFITIFSLATCLSWAQSQKTSDLLDGTISFGNSQWSLSIQYAHLWALGKKQKLSIGYGVRFTSYFGSNQYYQTAPAELTSESTSPFIIFKDNINKNIDSLFISSPQINLLNTSITIHYRISKKITAGFNIDAIGFSFGKSNAATYINGAKTKSTEGSPTAFNVLLISDNDRGSLNSEFFALYQVNERWSLKAGAQFLFTEYTTDSKVQLYPKENDRFRNKSLMFALGVSYRIR